MRLPELTEQYTTRDYIEVFGGYNHNLRIGDGEFYDMKNLTSTYYPVLATRQPRGLPLKVYADSEYYGYRPVAMCDKDGLCVLEVTDEKLETTEWHRRARLCIGEKAYYIGQAFLPQSSSIKRTLISMGSYVIIMPDKLYINTADIDESEGSTFPFVPSVPDINVHRIEAEYTSSEPTPVTFSLCKMDGTEYEIDKVSPDEPTENLTNGYVWLDTSSTPTSLKQYSSASGMWSSVASTYIKIKSPGIGASFEEYDGVRISGVTVESLADLNNTMVIYAKGDDYIVVVGILDDAQEKTQNDAITVSRVMPDMDFVFESGNRLWGCRYGLNRDGEVVNEIYASKLGDFKNWECFLGTSQDSYVASLGTDGVFTGAISYLGNPTFFKQHCIHTVYGNYPATYQIQNTECRGVQQGCHNSLAIIDGVLYYKALGGVCAYTGSLPTEIGSALGEISKRYYGAYAGAYRHKYYIGMSDALDDDESTWLYVYDTEKGMWHKEDEYNGREFCYCNTESVDQLYYLVPNTDGGYDIRCIIGESDKADTEDIDWFAETGVLGVSSPDKKYISRISIRLSIDVGTRVYVSAEYDSSGRWERLGAIVGTSLKTFTFPVRPKRCDHLRLRIEGTGAAKIYSISKTLEQGSEI